MPIPTPITLNTAINILQNILYNAEEYYSTNAKDITRITIGEDILTALSTFLSDPRIQIIPGSDIFITNTSGDTITNDQFKD